MLAKATFKKEYMHKDDLYRFMNGKSKIYDFEVQNKDLNRLFLKNALKTTQQVLKNYYTRLNNSFVCRKKEQAACNK